MQTNRCVSSGYSCAPGIMDIELTICTRAMFVGDAYIAACGLYDEVEPEKQAKAVVGFAVELENELTKFNEANNENIHIRCGIHIGSLTSCVLGTECNTFELYGG